MFCQDYTSLYNRLFYKDNTTTIYSRNIQLLATELFKEKNRLSPPFINEIFGKNEQHYRKTEFKKNDVKTVYCGTETLTFLGPGVS